MNSTSEANQKSFMRLKVYDEQREERLSNSRSPRVRQMKRESSKGQSDGSASGIRVYLQPQRAGDSSQKSN
jgi:hypothetical protein